MQAEQRPVAVVEPSPKEGPPPPPAPRPTGRRPFVVLGGVLLVTLLAIGGYLLLTAGQVSTDDAQVSADLVPIAARVAGRIQKLSIKENQHVKKGDIIAVIDDAELVARVRGAEAEVESAQAQAAQGDAQVSIVTATSTGNLSSAKAAYSGSSVGVASANAQLLAAKARLVRAEADGRKADSDLRRAHELRAVNAVAEKELDDAQVASDSAQAALAQARAEVTAAEEAKRAAFAHVSEAAGRVTQSAPIDAQIAAAQASADLAHARVKIAEAALDIARLQLSYTKVTAPADGTASKLAVQEGQLVNVAQPLVELVPEETFVVANFKETQIGAMHPGQHATLELDAYPHREFEGRVESLSGGTGASFSLFPADNASGNFVKVVQRVPVRIAWVNLPKDVHLFAGLSVDATVDVGR